MLGAAEEAVKQPETGNFLGNVHNPSIRLYRCSQLLISSIFLNNFRGHMWLDEILANAEEKTE